MSSLPLVSVCVPAYERPGMLRQLINSYVAQDYAHSELVITDDSNSADVADMVAALRPDARIRYAKNPTNLGYGENLRLALDSAKGDVVIILGDDDAFLVRDAISRFAAAFMDHPDIAYAYCNHVQFSNELRVEYVNKCCDVTTVFQPGESAIKGIWTTSIFIAGLAYRRSAATAAEFPGRDMLFPQLEFVGDIISDHSAVALQQVMIAGRAHTEQLGFFAIKGERIKSNERHGTIELIQIFGRLRARHNYDFDESFLVDALVGRYRTNMLKERLAVSRKRVLENYRAFTMQTPAAGRSRQLKISAAIVLLMPRPAIQLARFAVLRVVRHRNSASFSAFEAQLRAITAASDTARPTLVDVPLEQD